MSSATQIRLLQAVGVCLRSIARMLLRSGIGYRQFSELAKVAFMQEALGERDSRGRTTNLSRVSVRTGISRKEVARLRARLRNGTNSHEVADGPEYHSGHAARVLQLWFADERFLTQSGAPLPLEFAGSEPSFCTIVRAAGGDVPPGAVRAELLDARAIVDDGDGILTPIKRYFVPADVGEELIVGFTHIVTPVLEGLARNTDRECKEPFIQRLTYSDRLPPSAVLHFRAVARERASEFVQSVDDWLTMHESKSDVAEEDAVRVGLGVFYYEGPPPSETRGPLAPIDDVDAD